MPPKPAYRDEYRWIDKDPICDTLRSLISRDRRTPTEIGRDARLHYSTILNILYGKTRRPQHATVSALASTLRYSVTWSSAGQPTVIIPPYQKPEEPLRGTEKE